MRFDLDIDDLKSGMIICPNLEYEISVVEKDGRQQFRQLIDNQEVFFDHIHPGNIQLDGIKVLKEKGPCIHLNASNIFGKNSVETPCFIMSEDALGFLKGTFRQEASVKGIVWTTMLEPDNFSIGDKIILSVQTSFPNWFDWCSYSRRMLEEVKAGMNLI